MLGSLRNNIESVRNSMVPIFIRAISMHKIESKEISNRKYLSKTILAKKLYHKSSNQHQIQHQHARRCSKIERLKCIKLTVVAEVCFTAMNDGFAGAVSPSNYYFSYCRSCCSHHVQFAYLKSHLQTFEWGGDCSCRFCTRNTM